MLRVLTASMWGSLERMEPKTLGSIEEALAGSHGPGLIALLSELSMHHPGTPVPAVKMLAEELGLVRDGVPTAVGYKVGDSCRELFMWEARQRRLHEADRLAVMRTTTFEARDVLELGCGFGCNLLSLQGVAKTAIGVEIEPIYVQMSAVLAQLSGCEAPEIIEAGASRTGLASSAYDVVLNLGALQYMPIEDVLAETARVLRTGGKAIMILSHLTGFLGKVVGRFPKMPWRARARESVTIAGMLVYPWVGRAFTRPFDPVYPSQRRMRRWLDDVGMTLEQTEIIGHETCYVAIKR